MTCSCKEECSRLSAQHKKMTKRTNLVQCLDKAAIAYSMEISAEKSKLITNNASGINTKIKVKDRSLRQSQASSTFAQL